MWYSISINYFNLKDDVYIMESTKKSSKQFFLQYTAEKAGLTTQSMAEFFDEYIDMQVLYRSAIREASSRLEVLDDEFQFRHKRNPIHSIQTRLKTPQSIVNKMYHRGLTPNIEVMKRELTDIAGIRVICSYVDDIYNLADLLCNQKGVEHVRTRDYIENPKPNGYRSLHLVIKVPVYFSTGDFMVPVEIQIRTIAMDFWASLEHELHYKTNVTVDDSIVSELLTCAESIADLDCRMQSIYQRLEKIEEKQNKN